jgi:hypothetical protein
VTITDRRQPKAVGCRLKEKYTFSLFRIPVDFPLQVVKSVLFPISATNLVLAHINIATAIWNNSCWSIMVEEIVPTNQELES